MQKSGVGLVVVILVAAAAAAQHSSSAHVMVTSSELKWGAAPTALPRGAELVVLSGDPSQAGPYALRLRMPAGYRIAPHWHPTDENVTVVAGTFSMGMGDRVDQAAVRELPAGSYAVMPAEARHYAFTRGGATVQVHGMGPFAITYVNPSDDPRVASSR